MSNQINEGAARYKTDNNSSHSREGGDLPVPSDNRETRNCRSREVGNPLPIIDHLDLWTSTVTQKSTSGRGSNSKIELTGIKKLRELILELAVRGKLVAQNPDDEPASKLLEKIEAEKAQLIKEGKLKKQKPVAPVSEGEKPFELPEGWEWCRLAKLGWITSSSRVKQKDWKKEGIPFFRAREIVQLSKKGKVDNELYISDDLFQELTKTGTTPEPDDVMLTGVGTIGVPYLVQANDLFYFKDASVLIFKNVTGMYPQYLLKFFKCPLWINSIHKESMGTTVHTLTIIRASETLLPLPPLAEQQRIVAKVDELMALCDQLEQQSEHQLTAHQQLTDTLLATLTESANAQELNDNWQRLAQHFDLLFSGPMGAWAIDRLKDTVLQLAVMGKLVPQNPEDEPASKLLARVAVYLDQISSTKRISKLKRDNSTLSPEDFHHPIPQGWAWAEINDIFVFINGKAHEQYITDNENGYVLVNSKFVSNSGIFRKFVTERLTPLSANDIAIVMSDVPNGRALARCYLIENDHQYTLNQRIGGLSSSPDICIKYLIKAIDRNNYLLSYDDGKKQTNLKKVHILSTPIPVPPLAEQYRIVAKVDELFALCDQLKDRLQQASETEQHLTNAIVEQALE
jgi:type I restriction enzyme S subunit